jgi:hypothetical protein
MFSGFAGIMIEEREEKKSCVSENKTRSNLQISITL